MNKIIVAIAMKGEFDPKIAKSMQEANPELEFVYTGVGKVKAAHTVTDKINQLQNQGHEINHVINIGTAGGRNLEVGDVVCCDTFFQQDMNIQALGCERGVDLNTNYGFKGDKVKSDKYGQFIKHNAINLDYPKVICATQDAFDNSEQATLPELETSVEDMEAYALALVCKEKNLDFTSLKYVSNKLGKSTNLEEQGKDFDQDIQTHKAENKLCSALNKTISAIEPKQKCSFVDNMNESTYRVACKVLKNLLFPVCVATVLYADYKIGEYRDNCR